LLSWISFSAFSRFFLERFPSNPGTLTPPHEINTLSSFTGKQNPAVTLDFCRKLALKKIADEVFRRHGQLVFALRCI